ELFGDDERGEDDEPDALGEDERDPQGIDDRGRRVDDERQRGEEQRDERVPEDRVGDVAREARTQPAKDGKDLERVAESLAGWRAVRLGDEHHALLWRCRRLPLSACFAKAKARTRRTARRAGPRVAFRRERSAPGA